MGYWKVNDGGEWNEQGNLLKTQLEVTVLRRAFTMIEVILNLALICILTWVDARQYKPGYHQLLGLLFRKAGYYRGVGFCKIRVEGMGILVKTDGGESRWYELPSQRYIWSRLWQMAFRSLIEFSTRIAVTSPTSAKVHIIRDVILVWDIHILLQIANVAIYSYSVNQLQFTQIIFRKPYRWRKVRILSLMSAIKKLSFPDDDKKLKTNEEEVIFPRKEWQVLRFVAVEKAGFRLQLHLQVRCKEVNMKMHVHASTGSGERHLMLKGTHTVICNPIWKLLLVGASVIITIIYPAFSCKDPWPVHYGEMILDSSSLVISERDLDQVDCHSYTKEFSLLCALLSSSGN